MDDAASRQLAVVVLVVVGVVLALRMWASFAYPLLDVSDRGPLWAALVGALVCAALTWKATRTRPRAERIVFIIMGATIGVALGDGSFRTINGLLDRSETRQVPYAIAERLPGRRGTTIALTHDGADAPQTIWVLEYQIAGDATVGRHTTVPVRRGACGSAWRAGAVKVTSE